MKTHKNIQNLLLTNQQKNTESIMVFVAALFTYVLLPQLMIRYLYADQQLLEVPAALEYIPVTTFAVAMIHFLYVVVGNMMRGKKLKELANSQNHECDCGGSCCGGTDDTSMESMLDPEELAELEKIVDEVLETPKKKDQKLGAKKKVKIQNSSVQTKSKSSKAKSSAKKK